VADEDRQRQMFGMTLDQVISEKPKFENPGLWAMSILSDVQEMLARIPSDRKPDPVILDRARQWINKAKYWIDVERGDE
jgi:hypothetical protein